MKKKHIFAIIIIIFAIIIFTVAALCIPIKRSFKDGGTVEYNAVLYSVRKVHSLNVNGYEEGTKIRLLLWTIYDDVRLVEYEVDDEAEGVNPGGKDEAAAEKSNRKKLKKVTGYSNDKVDTLLNFFDNFNMGEVQEIEMEKADVGETLHVVAEDGTNYKILLTNGSVDGIQNEDTGEWVVRSYR